MTASEESGGALVSDQIHSVVGMEGRMVAMKVLLVLKVMNGARDLGVEVEIVVAWDWLGLEVGAGVERVLGGQ